VVQLPPLALPPEHVASAAQAMRWPAVRLFADRMGRPPTDGEAADIADICRRLDGIPLALELAAANAGMLGVRALARRLGDGLHLRGGQRGRHRTMEAALDWSYALLGEQERQLLQRLSPLRRGFSLDEALQLGADNLAAWPDTLDAFEGLLRQSMLATISDTDARRYRLLETTRRYAAARLAESHDYQAVMARLQALAL
jgi:predicted ATPase